MMQRKLFGGGEKPRNTTADRTGTDRPRPVGVSATSVAAHEAAKPRAASRQTQVLGVLARAGAAGATREEVALALGAKDGAICAPVRRLLALGLAGERGDTRRTSTGTAAKIVRATDAGMAAAARLRGAGQ